MEPLTFIQDLAVVMIVAAVVSVVFHRYDQPRVIGYILAGVIVGPHTPPFAFIHDEASIRTLADLGVMFLMFSLGLDFSFRKIKSVAKTVGVTAALDVVLMLWLGYTVGRAMGWGRMESVFLGAVICDSSTTLLAKTLGDLGWTRRPFVPLIFGTTLLEDLLAIVLIAVLNGLGMTGTVQPGVLVSRLGEMSVFLVVVVIAGLLAVPRLLNSLSKYKSDELLLITVLGLCFGVSLVAVKLQFSLALGAFLMGAVTAEARAIERIDHLVAPLRHMFSAVFFVTVGLMVVPLLLVKYLLPILLLTALVIAGKTFNCTLGGILSGQRPGDAFRAGLGLAQIGEFAYIIAAMGIALGVTNDSLYQVAVAVSLLTTVLSPYVLRMSDPIAARLKRLAGPRLMEGLDLYQNWLSRIGEARGNNVVGRVVRRSVWIVSINAAFIVALFLIGAYLAGRQAWIFPSLERWRYAGNLLIWLLAAVVSLPLYVSSLRKLQALGMIWAEIIVPINVTAGWAPKLRALIANVFLLLGTVALGVLTFVVSATLLPSWREQVLLLAVMGLFMWLRWRKLIGVYASAQTALRELFARETQRASAPVVQSLMSVHMETVVVPPASAVAGFRIGDVKIRNRTGANIVSLERGEKTIVNPGPEEIIHPGDRLLLLGEHDQLERALLLLR